MDDTASLTATAAANAALSGATHAGDANMHSPAAVLARRELFWHNVMREILTSLSVLRLKRSDAPYDPQAEERMRQTFDGRLAIITTLGNRIPIAEVHPVFACSVTGTSSARQLSADVQCTVFQIRTPSGEVHTLPLHEMRGFHALTPELMAKLEAQAAAANLAQGGKPKPDEPFGFGAFTSIARELDDEPVPDPELPITRDVTGPGLPDPDGPDGDKPTQ